MTSRLASLLVQDGRVSARKMADAFQRQVIFGGTLDTILLEMGSVDEGMVLEYLGRAAGMPVSDAAPSEIPPPELLARYTAELAERHRAAPLTHVGHALQVLVVDPPDRDALVRLGATLAITLEPWVAAEYRFHERMQQVYGRSLPERWGTLAARLKSRPRAVTPRKVEHTPTMRFAPTPAPASSAVPSAVVSEPTAPMPAPPAAARSVAPPIEARPVAVPRTEPVITADPSTRWPADDYVVPSPQLEVLTRADDLGIVVTDAMPVAAESAAQPVVAEPAAQAPAATPTRIEEPTIEEPPAPVQGLSLDEGRAALDSADDRDAVFETLCRMARDRFPFVALFTIQGEVATARQALGADWFDQDALASVTVDLSTPSALRTAVQTLAPFIGRVGDDATLGGILRFLDRHAPLPAALVPVVLRDRAVAVLYVDSDGRVLAADELVGLVHAAAEGAKAFLRLIKSKKSTSSDKPRSRKAVTPEPVAAVPQAEPSPPIISNLSAVGDLADAALLSSAPPAATLHDGQSTGLGGPSDLAALVDSVEREDASAARAAGLLVGQGAQGAQALLSRFPGPLRFGHRKLNTVGQPLVEHGPLVALAPRFGSVIAPLLLPRLEDGSPDVRYYCALVIGELRPENAIVPLGYRLFDVDTAVRRAAAQALGRYQPSSTMRALLDALRNELVSPDLVRQRQATVALGELRDALSVPRLVDLLKHRDMEIVDLAHRALVQITKQDFGTTRWRWRSWWEKNREQSRIDWLFAGLDQPAAEARRSAAEELSSITTDRFGFHAAYPRRDREEAARRWAAWYQRNPGVLAEERKSQ